MAGLQRHQDCAVLDMLGMLHSPPLQVIVTPHSAFLTKEALCNIADTTVGNVRDCALGPQLRNEVPPPPAA